MHEVVACTSTCWEHVFWTRMGHIILQARYRHSKYMFCIFEVWIQAALQWGISHRSPDLMLCTAISWDIHASYKKIKYIHASFGTIASKMRCTQKEHTPIVLCVIARWTELSLGGQPNEVCWLPTGVRPPKVAFWCLNICIYILSGCNRASLIVKKSVIASIGFPNGLIHRKALY